MKSLLLIQLTVCFSSLCTLCNLCQAQLPIAVYRSAVQGGAVIQLPPIAVNIGGFRNGNETMAASATYSMDGSPFVQLSTNTFTSGPNLHVYSSAYTLGAKTITIPLVTISPDASGNFSSSITVTEQDNVGAVSSGTQTYDFFMVEDQGGGIGLQSVGLQSVEKIAPNDGTAPTAQINLDALSVAELPGATNGLTQAGIVPGGTTAPSSSKNPDPLNTVLPAAVTGMVGVGAMVTSDSLNQASYSQEFSRPQ